MSSPRKKTRRHPSIFPKIRLTLRFALRSLV